MIVCNDLNFTNEYIWCLAMINMVNLYLDSSKRPQVQSAPDATLPGYAREAMRTFMFGSLFHT